MDRIWLNTVDSIVPGALHRITNRLLYQLSYLGAVYECNIAVKKVSNQPWKALAQFARSTE
jgi:hypothetical protein